MPDHLLLLYGLFGDVIIGLGWPKIFHRGGGTEADNRWLGEIESFLAGTSTLHISGFNCCDEHNMAMLLAL